jgi:hypothetical protein
MRKIFSLLAVLIIFSFTTNITELSKKERDDAIKYCKETQKGLASAIKGLSENQLNWKPNDSTWSAADCVEHLTLSEKNLFGMLMNTLKEDANPAKRSELKMDDEAVKKLITDRSFRVKTREGFIPTGEFGNAAGALKVFNERREALLKYIKETKDDLRNHFFELPFGLIDSYQVILFLSGHTIRHTDQIAELKAMPGFPKSK